VLQLTEEEHVLKSFPGPSENRKEGGR
jgi:hypothetical protein